MRVRTLDIRGDMTFGNGSLNFYADSSEAVLQCVYTRLKLWAGEWFLDTTEGTDWLGKCLGKNTLSSATAEIRRVILETEGVQRIDELTVEADANSRGVSVRGTITTDYGATTVNYNGAFTIGDSSL